MKDQLGKDDLGALFVVGFEGTRLDRETSDLLRRHRPAGVVLFQRNCQDPEQILSLARQLQATNPEQRPFLAIDHEGGRVCRLAPPFTLFPEAESLGRAGLDSLAYSAASVMARELAAVGIGCNFAPVLDLNTNPANPIIGDRALGTDPQQVARLAASVLRGFRDHGITGCGKHFPGHGDTDADSHLTLPQLKHDQDRLEAVEMAPYQIVLQGEPNLLEMIMTAHLMVPALDPELPATLSPRVLGGILRRRLGFEGVIVTDDLEMKAVAERYTLPEAAQLALRAGADLLLICHTPAALPVCLERIARSLDRGEVAPKRLRQSLGRIRNFRRRLEHRRPPEKLRRVLFDQIGCPEHQCVSDRVRSFKEKPLPV